MLLIRSLTIYVGNAKVTGLKVDWEKVYNEIPEKASCFRGRVLLGFHLESHRPEQFKSKIVHKPFMLNLSGADSLTLEMEPQLS